ncbi:eIF2A-related protein [Iningainema tapete]|uniref:Caspase family protein n=1 Tax=Iningainema tapete BLCC-T55 TaxID=2748662 RepID=A0A8J6XRR4_9CYAN|nr:caspase family protein [Iningainema tapete]MBD2775387.1 caspase family protein [Iningainema tapete BLCC-T55]
MAEIKRNLAVVVGINQYINCIPVLKTAVNDATKLAHILETKYQYQVLLLLDSEANYAKLYHLFTTLEKQKFLLADGSTIQLQPDDRILFYFAGHGIALDTLDCSDGPAGYLVPQDARLDDSASLLPMKRLHDALLTLPCRHLLVILDCCFAGAFRWSGSREAVRRSKMYRERYERFISGCAQQVITSAADDEKAADFLYRLGQRREHDGHSPFAELLFAALEGAADLSNDGVITATELYVYLHSELLNISARQTPGFCQLKRHDKGEYIFTVPEFDPNNLKSAPVLDESKNPYRGLESFELEHSKLFFGRKTLIEKLKSFVTNHSLTVVLGASGSGKSSLVKAGLIAQLKQDEQQWRILAPIRPGESPFTALNNTLIMENLPVFTQPDLAFEQDLQTLAQSVKVWSEAHPNTKLLLVIDQFEELVTLCRNDLERIKFLSGLARAIKAFANQLRIVVTVRSDFEPQFQNTALEPYWQQARFIVPAMTRDELRQVIVEPAACRVMYFEPSTLVEQLIDEVIQMPAALPLLSFTLSELYLKYIRSASQNKRNNRAITQQDYEELGGVTRSLTQRADYEYEQLVKLDPVYAQTIKHVMLRMVALGGGELSRRRVFLTELKYPKPENQRVQLVIERFAAARLLVQGQDTEGNIYVEPAHDFLVRGWQKLQTWKDQELGSLLLQRELTPTANKWATQRRDKQALGLLWNDDPRLPLIQQLLKFDPSWLNSLELEFFEHSIEHKRNKLGRLISSVVFVIVALSGLTMFAFAQRQFAFEEEIKGLTSLSESNLLRDDQLGAMIAIAKAGKQLKHIPWVNKKLREQVTRTWRQKVYNIQEHKRLEGHKASIISVSFSPDGKTIATASKDKTAKLWSLDGQQLQTLHGHTEQVLSVNFSPNGKTIATASGDKTFKIWNLNGKLIRTFTAHNGEIYNIIFSPDGRLLVTASADQTVKLWNQEGQLLKTLKGHTADVLSVSFSPDGKTIATASQDGTAKLWNLKGQLLKILRGHDGWIWRVRFSPDGKTIATASDDKTVKLWNQEGQLLKTLKEHGGSVYDVNFSPDGKTIATANEDGTIKLWNLDAQLLQTLKGHNKQVNSVSFSPDGKTIATASRDGTVKLWSQDIEELNIISRGHQDWIFDVSFSPDGKTIATASKDGTAKLWRSNGQLLQTLKGHKVTVNRVSFSPDGKTIATASQDGTAKLWNLNGLLLHTMKGHKDGVSSVSFSPDGKIIATANSDGTVKLWSLHGQLLQTLTVHPKAVRDVSFSPDGKTIATASLDGTAKLWSLHGQLRQTLMGNSSYVYDLSFSPDGKTIATANEDGTVKLWNLDGQLLKNLPGHSGAVLRVSFSPDSKTIATASTNGPAKLWSINGEELQTLSSYSGNVLGVSFSLDGKTIATVDDERLLILWKFNLDLPQLEVIACKWLRNYLKYKPNVEKSDRNLCQ